MYFPLLLSRVENVFLVSSKTFINISQQTWIVFDNEFESIVLWENYDALPAVYAAFVKFFRVRCFVNIVFLVHDLYVKPYKG